MCGITGFLGEGNEKNLENMTKTLVHRGPDDFGIYFDPQSRIGLGNQRLSVIDISPKGHMPMWDSKKEVCITFNGEIYNFQRLRKGLQKKGYKFRSNSDTETILYLYKEYDTKAFSKLNGMFAIALFDKRTRKLILVRDRLGQKPLYYATFGNTLIFGSEIKAILTHPLAKRKIDPHSFRKYLTYDYIPTPSTIFENIYKLEPGTFLECHKSQVTSQRFWNVGFDKHPEMSEYEYLEELDKKIGKSVSQRLVSDVPLGMYLSGGIDSATIAYYAQKSPQFKNKKLKTFSIGFEDKSFDESNYSNVSAKALGTDHYLDTLSPSKALDLIPKVIGNLDEPMADASIIPTYFLSELTRKQVTVTLSGDGGDELFSGYQTFQAHKVANLYEKLPSNLRKKLENIIAKLPTSLNNISLDYKAKRLIYGLHDNRYYRDILWIGTFHKEIKDLLSDKTYRKTEDLNAFEDIDGLVNEFKGESKENILHYLYLRLYLMDFTYVKVDRASMLTSLEARSPFMNYQLVDFVNSMPENLKLKGFTQPKYILKELMKDKLPTEIVYRAKKGFGMPIAKWLMRDDYQKYLKKYLNKKRIEKEGFFNWSFVKSLVDDHMSGHKDNRKPLWNLLVFQIWQENWHR